MRTNDVFRDFEGIAKDFATKLKDYFEDGAARDVKSAISRTDSTTPPVDILEDNEYIYADIELPGMEKNDISITMQGNDAIVVSGERVQPAGTIISSQRTYGPFNVRIRFPDGKEIDSEAISAAFTNGILRITLPKKSTNDGHEIAII